MRLTSFARRLIAALATWAALFAALAPALSRALAAASSAHPYENTICTTDGLRRVALPAERGAPAPPAAPAFDHCVFCASHAGPLAPPPAPAALPLARGGDAVPRLVLHAPRPLFAWSAAQPRAPPILS